MGNRSKYVAVAAAAGTAALVSQRRRAGLRRAAESVRETITPSHGTDLPTDRAPGSDEGHAPGHPHLPRGADQDPPRFLGRLRPWASPADDRRRRLSGA